MADTTTDDRPVPIDEVSVEKPVDGTTPALETAAAHPAVEAAKDAVTTEADAPEKTEGDEKPVDEKTSDVKSTEDEPSTKTENVESANNGTEAKDEKKPREAQSSSNGRKLYKDYKKNIKTDFSSLKETDDPIAIRKQVEFYFSDSNLAQDKFLFNHVGGSSNKAVPIALIHSFKRMQHFQPYAAVLAALKDSTKLDIVDDDSAIKRKTPLSDEFQEKPQHEVLKVIEDKGMARSIYAKGFGAEKPSTQFDIEAFFEKHGATRQVRLRRSFDKNFKGSVFVEFDSEETQKRFLELEPKPMYEGRTLDVKSKKQYCDEKVELIKSGVIRKNDEPYPTSRGRRYGGDDDRSWKERRDEDAKNGFRSDRRGGGRGRGGRGGRGGRDRRGGGGGGRDRNEERRRNEERAESKNDDSKADAGSEEKAKKDTDTSEAPKEQPASEASSKKRTIDEADAHAEGGGEAAKKQKEEVAAES